MTYTQSVEYINSMLRFGSKPGLERIGILLERLDNPQNDLKFIHVAGTNGKGSICAYISSVFKAAGYKTGLFISPYVTDFRERFQINGNMIEPDVLASLTDELKSIVDTLDEQDQPTEFEFITALAYMYFQRSHCDIVVLEVGLGGMYDSTNIIHTPICSVIGSIGLDHTAVLGDTVEKIAQQKAGIIKPNGNTVCYPVQPGDVMSVVASTAEKFNNQMIVPDVNRLKMLGYEIDGDSVEYDSLTFKLPILGEFQPYNAITAIEAIRCAVDYNITDENIIYGIEHASTAARCEILDKTRPIIIDGAHNPDGIKALCGIIKKYCKTPPVAVIGMMADKDVDAVLSKAAPLFKKIYTVTVNNPRTLTAADLCKKAATYCSDVQSADTIEHAISYALDGDGGVCVCGSFYLASDARKIILSKI